MSPAARSKLALDRAFAYGALVRAGVLRPERPDRSVRALQALARWGATAAAASKTNAIRHPDAIGLVDDEGTLTFAELHACSNALAHALRERAVGERGGVAILCRNHRYFVDALVAASKLGARAIFLNTSSRGRRRRRCSIVSGRGW